MKSNDMHNVDKNLRFNENKFVRGYRKIMREIHLNKKTFSLHHYKAACDFIDAQRAHLGYIIKTFEKIKENEEDSSLLCFILGYSYCVDELNSMQYMLEKSSYDEIVKNRQRLSNDNIKKAISYFTAAKKLDPSQPLIHWNLAFCYAANNDSTRTQGSLKAFRRCFKKPRVTDGYEIRDVCIEEQMGLFLKDKQQFFSENRFLSNYEKIIRCLGTSAESSSSHWVSGEFMALIFYNRAYCNSVIRILRKIQKKKGESALLSFAMGYANCVNELRMLRNASLEFASGGISEYRLRWPIDKIRKSLNSFVRARELDPEQPNTHLHLALCYAVLNDPTNTYDSLRAFRRTFRKSGVISYWCGDVDLALFLLHVYKIEEYLSNEKYGIECFHKKLEELKNVEDFDDLLIKYIYLFNRWFLEKKKYDYFLCSLKKAIDLFPDHGAFRHVIGRYYMIKNDYEKALPHLEKAIELYSDSSLTKIESKVMYEYALVRRNWPSFDLSTYEKTAKETFGHISVIIQHVCESKMDQYENLLSLPQLLDIDRRITNLRLSHNSTDLKARVLNICKNLLSFKPTSDQQDIDFSSPEMELWLLKTDYFKSIFTTKLIYLTYLATILDVMRDEDIDSIVFFDKVVENTKSFLHENDFKEELDAFERLDTVSAKKGNRSFEEFIRAEGESILQGVLLDLGKMDGSFTRNSIDRERSDHQKMLSDLEQLKEGQQLINAGIGKISNLFTLGAHPPPEAKKIPEIIFGQKQVKFNTTNEIVSRKSMPMRLLLYFVLKKQIHWLYGYIIFKGWQENLIMNHVKEFNKVVSELRGSKKGIFKKYNLTLKIETILYQPDTYELKGAYACNLNLLTDIFKENANIDELIKKLNILNKEEQAMAIYFLKELREDYETGRKAILKAKKNNQIANWDEVADRPFIEIQKERKRINDILIKRGETIEEQDKKDVMVWQDMINFIKTFNVNGFTAQQIRQQLLKEIYEDENFRSIYEDLMRAFDRIRIANQMESDAWHQMLLQTIGGIELDVRKFGTQKGIIKFLQSKVNRKFRDMKNPKTREEQLYRRYKNDFKRAERELDKKLKRKPTYEDIGNELRENYHWTAKRFFNFLVLKDRMEPYTHVEERDEDTKTQSI